MGIPAITTLLINAQMSVTQVALSSVVSSGLKESTMIKTKTVKNLIIVTMMVMLTVKKKRIIASLCGEKQLQVFLQASAPMYIIVPSAESNGQNQRPLETLVQVREYHSQTPHFILFD